MAGSRGVDNRFFASAPTTEMDSRAGIPDPRVQAQLTDTVMQTDRDALAAKQADAAMAFRNREFDERSEQADADDARSDQYLGIQQAQFKRSQGNQDYERSNQRRAEIADTTRRWRAAATAGDAGGMKQALEELKRLGVRVEAYGPHAGQAQAQAPMTVTGSTQPRPPMSPTDAALSKQLTGIENKMVPQLQGKAPPPSPARPGNASDQALAAQMSAIEADMIPKLRGSGQSQGPSLNEQVGIDGEPVWPVSFFPPAPDRPSFLPGQRPVRARTAQSDAMLSPGDPLNNIK